MMYAFECVRFFERINIVQCVQRTATTLSLLTYESMRCRGHFWLATEWILFSQRCYCKTCSMWCTRNMFITTIRFVLPFFCCDEFPAKNHIVEYFHLFWWISTLVDSVSQKRYSIVLPFDIILRLLDKDVNVCFNYKCALWFISFRADLENC